MKYYLIIFTVSLITACDQTQKTPEIKQPADLTIRIDTLAEGLENPWSLAFLPDSSVLITERPGRLRLWKEGKLTKEPIEGVPAAWVHGQGGLLDVILHPDHQQNKMIFLSMAKENNGKGNTAIYRAILNEGKLSDITQLFWGSPLTNDNIHFGSRMVIDKDGYLYFSIGDRGKMENAQQLNNHCGKVMRIRMDGSIPEDNPFADQPGKLPEIWSYGHRNIQGMTINPETGKIWAHEHGPQGGDEVNIIQKGKNYGWPLATYGINYDDSVISENQTLIGMQDPVSHWTPSIAPCGMCFVNSEKYPLWKGNILAGALAGQHIHRLVMEDEKVIHAEKLLEGSARFRDVRQGPDGYIYILSESPGMFLRLRPE